MKVKVLRLGHRVTRDKRLTTHVALISRAFGTEEIILSGEKDASVISSVDSIVSQWGGSFKARYSKNWKKEIENRQKKYDIIHLTMYGIPFGEKISQLKKSKKPKLVIVGSEKVPGEVYAATDYNLSVSSQPHSEAGALAVFLYELCGIKKNFSNPKTKIIPSEKGKKFANENEKPEE